MSLPTLGIIIFLIYNLTGQEASIKISVNIDGAKIFFTRIAISIFNSLNHLLSPVIGSLLLLLSAFFY